MTLHDLNSSERLGPVFTVELSRAFGRRMDVPRKALLWSNDALLPDGLMG